MADRDVGHLLLSLPCKKKESGMQETKIPRHIKAKTPEKLEAIMSLLCRSYGYQHINFTNIQFVKGDWYAWYLATDKDIQDKEIARLKA